MSSNVIKNNDEVIVNKSKALLKRIPTKKNRKQVENALQYSIKMHGGQVRKSGLPFVSHCIDVANILIDWNMDHTTVVSALLHDVVEDTEVKLSDIEEEFGSDVASLVDGVTKVENIAFRSKEHKQAENFTKLFLSLARDLRVIIIKFADRLNNMETIQYLSSNKRIEIALETKEIFVPLAHRLGMAKLKWQLEDLSLKCLDLKAFNSIKKKIETSARLNEDILSNMIRPIKTELSSYKIESNIFGRYKSISSIHRKIENTGKEFEDIYDLYAIRIIVDKIEECYLALGVIHSIYPPLQDRFKDFIATPKTNGYQSIHTTVLTKDNRFTEFQIRTKDMDRTAEVGVAAHWLYKGNDEMEEFDSQVLWLRDLLSMLNSDSSDPEELMDLLKIDMFEDEIFVFTPRGDLIKLPVNSTPLDFAFAIHGDLGFTTVRSKVNKKLVPLSYSLKSGDIVEIETSKNQTPNSGWLKFVKTSRAKHEISKYLRKIELEESIKIGNEILEKSLRKLKILDRLSEFKKGYAIAGFKTLNNMLSDIGRGGVIIKDVIPKIFPDLKKNLPKEIDQTEFIEIARSDVDGINLDGLKNLVVNYGKCCNPIPGDDVIGYISRGRGLIIHELSCTNLSSLSSNQDRLVSVNWNAKENLAFRSKIHITCIDTAGMLNEIANIISKNNLNMLDVSTDVTEGSIANIWIICKVQSRAKLNAVIKDIQKLKNVDSVERVHDG
ncbi:MAG: bifunctional (p)ppGpp synthetase/guanosine-3',5'-bis(diphosphate) 3'-pyrophosphohydrolase [Candidatus Marinimicrobia bacterium]|nr:bifunctional (p)ppGpp synthetase/guanosine-3',5'-bis(diphosphate) 3'-pyrophosphohydrolase [Candidatus Neomarinimicrobiota bacterium]MDA0754010.1 bifunctional (p)ppGpp synthetase/guanosine-3',5'-bis(diphosphate) 3'-pyrophosphohydrolase [Candidatus Neomarinimicrobiota bacterium]MDA1363566.1 bifunctional (p)ppGpp synthetase/guanosine-3',5'-bis(diphosphate) 3'-pyrophosphohydrolase [Candidatus Neomarinimicrobiota bacterium]